MAQTIGYARASGDRLATVHPIRLDRTTGADALAALDRFLDRHRKLSPRTVAAYRRQARAYVGWPGLDDHADAFDDEVGAEGAVTAWRRHLLGEVKPPLKPASVNQGLAAVTLMYEQIRIRIKVKRSAQPRAGAPKALTPAEEERLRKAGRRAGPRERALVELMLGCGARLDEAARLDVDDVVISERSGDVRLFGKGDEVREVPLDKPGRDAVKDWLLVHPGGVALWPGRRGRLTTSGVKQLLLAIGRRAELPGFHPHVTRHTFATRQREQGADLSKIQELLGHKSPETTARYVRPSKAELQELVDRRWMD